MFTPAHMFSDHGHSGHPVLSLACEGQRWYSRWIVGGEAGLVTNSKRSGGESGRCSDARVFEDFSEPRQSMIWGRLISGCGRVSHVLSVDSLSVCSVDRARRRSRGIAILHPAAVLKRHRALGVGSFDV